MVTSEEMKKVFDEAKKQIDKPLYSVTPEEMKRYAKNKSNLQLLIFKKKKENDAKFGLKSTAGYDKIEELCLISITSLKKTMNGTDRATRTFLYKEEELLFLHLKENGLLSVYCPRLVIKHLEDVATNSINKSSEEKKKFLIQNQLKSTRILVCEYNKYLANYNSQKDKGKTT